MKSISQNDKENKNYIMAVNEWEDKMIAHIIDNPHKSKDYINGLNYSISLMNRILHKTIERTYRY